MANPYPLQGGPPPRVNGTVKTFNPDKQCGGVETTDQGVNLFYRGGGFPPGTRVSFDVIANPKKAGENMAINLRPLQGFSQPPPPAPQAKAAVPAPNVSCNAPRQTGTVKTFNPDNGCGGVDTDAGVVSLFYLGGGFPPGTRVSFDVIANPKKAGENMAINLQLLQPHAAVQPPKVQPPGVAAKIHQDPIPAGGPPRFAGIVVDGYGFLQTHAIAALRQMEQYVADEITSRAAALGAPSTCSVHPGAKYFFHPCPLDAVGKVCDEKMAFRTLTVLRDIRESLGYQVVTTQFKQKNGAWVASMEDVKLATQAAQACGAEFAPIGAACTSVRLSDLVIVTGDNDHQPTQQTSSHKELRWLLAMPLLGKGSKIVQTAEAVQRFLGFSVDVLPTKAAGRGPSPAARPPAAAAAAAAPPLAYNPPPIAGGGVPAVAHGGPAPQQTGTITTFNPDMRCGGLGTSAGVNLFYRGGGFPPGTRVSFDVVADPKKAGESMAINVKALDGAPPPPPPPMIGVAAAQGGNAPQQTGTITTFNADKGCGGLDTSAGVNLFYRGGGFPPGTRVSFDVVANPKKAGESMAINVKVLDGAPPPPRVPDGMILASGTPYPEGALEDNAGKLWAIAHGRRGDLCGKKLCTFGVKCKFLHRKLSDDEAQQIKQIRSDSGDLADGPVAPNAGAAQGPMVECQIGGVCDGEVCAADCFFCKPSKHAVCDECFSQYILQTFGEHRTTDADQPLPSLPCPCCDPLSTPALTDTEIARHASDAAFAVYLTIRQKWRDADTQANALKIIEEVKRQQAAQGKVVQTEAEKKLLQQQIQNAMGNTALMCPRCKYGPVQHFACSDLTAHNGEVTRGGTRIDNRCPNCQFFSARVSDWAKWDGEMRDFQKSAAAAAAAPLAAGVPRPAENTVEAIVYSLERIAGTDFDRALQAARDAMEMLVRRGEILLPVSPVRSVLLATVVARPEDQQRIANGALDILLTMQRR